jgi:hypothetical protein
MLWSLFYAIISAWMLHDSFVYFNAESPKIGWFLLIGSSVNAAVLLTYIF